MNEDNKLDYAIVAESELNDFEFVNKIRITFVCR